MAAIEWFELCHIPLYGLTSVSERHVLINCNVSQSATSVVDLEQADDIEEITLEKGFTVVLIRFHMQPTKLTKKLDFEHLTGTTSSNAGFPATTNKLQPSSLCQR